MPRPANSFKNSTWGRFVDEIGITTGIPGLHLVSLLEKQKINIDTPYLKKEFDDWYSFVINQKSQSGRLELAISFKSPGAHRRDPEVVNTGFIYIDMMISKEQDVQVIYITTSDNMAQKVAKCGILLKQYISFGGWPGTNAVVEFYPVAFQYEYVDKPPPPPPSRWPIYAAVALVVIAIVGVFLKKYGVSTAAATVVILLFYRKKWYITLGIGFVVSAVLFLVFK